jgi:hypothetical protein
MIRNKYYYYLVAFMLISSLFSCSKKEDSNQAKSNSLTFKMDNVAYKADSVKLLANGVEKFVAGYISNDKVFSIHIPLNMATGTFPTGDTARNYFVLAIGQTESYVTIGAIQLGSITFKELSETKYEGTFQGTIQSVLNRDSTRIITDGVFTLNR